MESLKQNVLKTECLISWGWLTLTMGLFVCSIQNLNSGGLLGYAIAVAAFMAMRVTIPLSITLKPEPTPEQLPEENK